MRQDGYQRGKEDETQGGALEEDEGVCCTISVFDEFLTYLFRITEKYKSCIESGTFSVEEITRDVASLTSSYEVSFCRDTYTDFVTHTYLLGRHLYSNHQD